MWPQNIKCGGRGVNMYSFIMESHLNCYQLKIDCYKYRLVYVSLMVTTKQKSIVDTWKIMRKESKHLLKKVIKPQTKAARKEDNREEQKTARKPLTRWQ